jgi:hypothetical protein
MTVACTEKEHYVELPEDKPNLSLCPCLMQAETIDLARECDLDMNDDELRELGKYCFFHDEEWKEDTLDYALK